MLQLGQQRKRKSTHAYSAVSSVPNKSTDNTHNDHGHSSKTKDGPIKVALSLFGLMVVVFLMFSVFQPKNKKELDRPPLQVVMEQQNQLHKQSQQHPPPNINLDDDANSAPKPNHDHDDHDDHAANRGEQAKLAAPKQQADIEIIYSEDKNDARSSSDTAAYDSDDPYQHPSHPARPPQSIAVSALSDEQLSQFFDTDIDARDRFNATNTPGVNHRGQLYIMNYIFLPSEQMMAIFLLTAEYLDPAHGLHAWPSRRRRADLPEVYKNIRSTIYAQYKSASPSFACVFRVAREVWVSQVDFVPNNTTRDRYVNEGTEIMRCNVPMMAINNAYKKLQQPSIFYDENATFSFVLTQNWQHLISNDEAADVALKSLVHISLSFVMGVRSGIGLLDHDEPLIYKKANQARYLTLCMPPISEPLAFLAEIVAHYIANLGIEHIYIGTFFAHDKVDAHRAKLLDRIRPWYEQGLVTIWPHEQPWIEFTDKAKSHWLNQCLYYAKSRDSYTLSLDADEFLVLKRIDEVYDKLKEGEFEARQSSMQAQFSSLVKSTVSKFDDVDDHFCWLTFESYQMWQLMYPEEQYMVRRFLGREQRAQLTWSKVIWNTKHLHFTGYHAGGACSAQDHDWRQVVNDWRESKDTKHVYRFNAEQEGALLHYYNCRQIRIEPKDSKLRNPWSKLANDSRMMDVYWTNIEHDFEKYKIQATYPDESDVMNTKYYREHYGFGNSMTNWYQKYSEDKKDLTTA